MIFQTFASLRRIFVPRPPPSRALPFKLPSTGSAAGSAAGRLACCIAFFAPCLYRMQEDEWIAGQSIRGYPHYVAGADQAGLSMADRAFPLQALSPQPGVGEVKVLAAVIVLAIVDADRLAVIEDRTVSRHPIGNLRDHSRDAAWCPNRVRHRGGALVHRVHGYALSDLRERAGAGAGCLM